jgi:hypothetical protein
MLVSIYITHSNFMAKSASNIPCPIPFACLRPYGTLIPIIPYKSSDSVLVSVCSFLFAYSCILIFYNMCLFIY